ncbi:hypothetical protein FBUS_10840, partial [Fasciolopsis buskii]
MQSYSWEELRAKARGLENELDEKLAALGNLGKSDGGRTVGSTASGKQPHFIVSGLDTSINHRNENCQTFSNMCSDIEHLLERLLDFSPQFIRDTFLGPGSGYNSASSSNFEPVTRAVVHSRIGVSGLSYASNTADLSSGWNARGLAPTTVRPHLPNRDPGAFLLERQSRLRSNRSYPDGDLSDGRLTLMTLANRAVRSGPKQEKDDQNNADSQSMCPSATDYKGLTNPISFHGQP